MIVSNSIEPWLGNKPDNWIPSRIRNVSQLSPGYSADKPIDDEYCTVVPMENISEHGSINTSTRLSFSEISGGLTLFEAGDVLFAKITPCMENGKGAFVSTLPTRYAFGSTEFHVLRSFHTINPRFLYFLTFNPVYREYAAQNMVGAAGQKRVSSRFLRDTRFYLPPRDEQERIAAYLDASCAAIDAAIDAKKKQMEVLEELRNSIIENIVTNGINRNCHLRKCNRDWIIQIPDYWNVVQMKRIVKRVDYGISVSTNDEGTFPVLKMGHISNGELTVPSNDFVDEVQHELILENGDLLYNRTNSPDLVGKAGIFRGTRNENITFASYLVRLRMNYKANPFFFNYVVNSPGFLTFARKLAIPSVQQSNLNSTRYCQISVPLPPLKEQLTLQKYLDEKTKSQSDITNTLTAQISTLTAYRKSLIHECVTGIRRISDADVRRAEKAV